MVFVYVCSVTDNATVTMAPENMEILDVIEFSFWIKTPSMNDS